MKPLIGVTTSEMRRGELATLRRHGEPPNPEMALGLTYVRAVELCGGLPVVLPPLDTGAVGELLARLDGVVLSGGPDLDPVAYGARAHPQLGPIEPPLDVFEYAVAREAIARGLPLLGVCRGTQALNVACGGSLIQHLPDAVGDGVVHRQAEAPQRLTHDVTIALHSRLGRIMGATRIAVNSFHHQAVDELGAGLRVSARADDGTIEAIESPSHPFVLGVQWHAETLIAEPPQRALFSALVRAAGGSGQALLCRRLDSAR